jgi:hypothetical protein
MSFSIGFATMTIPMLLLYIPMFKSLVGTITAPSAGWSGSSPRGHR